ncbi:hypothetical protein [Chitinophaga costaii]|uniref:hypothetical protein n=1 Tax=Chitinophaga costaii TaxID=1335309 RepID=UPI0013FD9C1C|nr:hypothetical protein [Chitinophaga costaii]
MVGKAAAGEGLKIRHHWSFERDLTGKLKIYFGLIGKNLIFATRNNKNTIAE